MHKQTIKTLGRITTLTLIILVFFRVTTAFLETENPSELNKYNFKSAASSELGNVWVAVSTNIWIRFEQNKNTSSTGNSNIKLGMLSWDTLADRDEVLSVNILALKDYNNLMRTDVKEFLSTASNKSKALDGFISQLELRYKNGVQNGRALELQVAKLEADMAAALEKVAQHKAEMAAGLKAHDTDAIMTAMDNYLIETNNYNIAQSNLMFVKYFVRKYLEFSVKNKTLLDTLINNKEALSNGSFIVIPDSWTNLLRDLNLILDESDLKDPSSDTNDNWDISSIPTSSLFESQNSWWSLFDSYSSNNSNLTKNFNKGIQMLNE